MYVVYSDKPARLKGPKGIPYLWTRIEHDMKYNDDPTLTKALKEISYELLFRTITFEQLREYIPEQYIEAFSVHESYWFKGLIKPSMIFYTWPLLSLSLDIFNTDIQRVSGFIISKEGIFVVKTELVRLDIKPEQIKQKLERLSTNTLPCFDDSLESTWNQTVKEVTHGFFASFVSTGS